jgi:hypothetical protein
MKHVSLLKSCLWMVQQCRDGHINFEAINATALKMVGYTDSTRIPHID